MSRKQAALSFNVNYHSICWIYRKYCKENVIKKSKRGGKKPMKLDDTHIRFIKSAIEENCALTLKALKILLFENFSINVSLSTIERQIGNFGFSFKRISTVTLKSISNDMKEKRVSYACWFLKLRNENRNIIFYDETGFQVVMRNLYGRSVVGKKAIKTVPSLKSKNITVMAAMSNKALILYESHTTPCNRTKLLQYMGRLIDKLEENEMENTVIIMDNASFHKCSEIRSFVENTSHELAYLPAYSPFFNPIENLFSQWKQLVRNFEPNSEVDLFNAIGNFKNILTEEHCLNYYKNVCNNCVDCINGKKVYDN